MACVREDRRSSRGFRAIALKSERGAELVEAAFILPILLTLLLGLFWMGRAYNAYQTINRAAMEGARFGAAPTCTTCSGSVTSTCSSVTSSNSPPSDSDITCAIKAALRASGLNDNPNPDIAIRRDIVLNASDPEGIQVHRISVSFGYPFTLVIPFVQWAPETITLHTEVEMTQEY